MTNNPLADLSVQQLKQALGIREKIESLQQELTRVLGGVPADLQQSVPGLKRSQPRQIGKRIVSAESRAKMAAAQLARRSRERKALKQTVAPAGSKPETAAKEPIRAKKGKQFGQLKESVIQVLKAAGPKGITLKEICGKLALSQGHLNTWLYATGKKIKEIKKIGRGVYAWKG